MILIGRGLDFRKSLRRTKLEKTRRKPCAVVRVRKRTQVNGNAGRKRSTQQAPDAEELQREAEAKRRNERAKTKGSQSRESGGSVLSR